MFKYALGFYAVALPSAVMAFGGSAAGITVAAQVVFSICVLLALATLLLGLMRKGF
jgi:uncharacterized membrane protein YtjA (UPF0391 family)